MSEVSSQNEQPLPFTSYPQHGCALLGRTSKGNCRHGYGLKFIRLTKQSRCAYCGLDLLSEYENWLNMALDHVVPRNACLEWDLPEDWCEDYSNRVLCCAACNTFRNRYTPYQDFERPVTLEQFYDLRDAIFLQRKALIKQKHTEEREFFNSTPWLK
jgi:hypothetical protein